MAKDTELSLQKGMTLEVIISENRVAFIGRVEKIRKGVVQISDTSDNKVPPVMFNAEIKFRGFLPGMKPVVGTGTVTGSDDKSWWIDNVTVNYISENRAFFRQNVSVPARVTRFNASSGAANGNAIIIDISGGGIGLICNMSYAVGDQLLITDLKLDGGEAFTLTCRVRRVMPRGKGYLYGCQFEGLQAKDEQRLLQIIFTLQRSERQRRKGS